MRFTSFAIVGASLCTSGLAALVPRYGNPPSKFTLTPSAALASSVATGINPDGYWAIGPSDTFTVTVPVSTVDGTFQFSSSKGVCWVLGGELRCGDFPIGPNTPHTYQAYATVKGDGLQLAPYNASTDWSSSSTPTVGSPVGVWNNVQYPLYYELLIKAA